MGPEVCQASMPVSIGVPGRSTRQLRATGTLKICKIM